MNIFLDQCLMMPMMISRDDILLGQIKRGTI